MLFNLALTSSLLFASAALANLSRGDSWLFERSTDKVVYYSNWAGAFFNETNGTFTSVTGKFTVPAVKGKKGSSASVWLGIDSALCGGGILQAGVTFGVTNDHNTPSYRAWYVWFPAGLSYFDDLHISAGDVVQLSVTAYSTTSGVVTVANLNNGQRRSRSLSSAHALCGQTAEWIVEDDEDSNNHHNPFAHFGTVAFTDATALGPGGTYTPEDAIVTDIKRNNKVLTSVLVDGSSVTIKQV